jgi:hypothetical protein
MFFLSLLRLHIPNIVKRRGHFLCVPHVHIHILYVTRDADEREGIINKLPVVA